MNHKRIKLTQFEIYDILPDEIWMIIIEFTNWTDLIRIGTKFLKIRNTNINTDYINYVISYQIALILKNLPWLCIGKRTKKTQEATKVCHHSGYSGKSICAAYPFIPCRDGLTWEFFNNTHNYIVSIYLFFSYIYIKKRNVQQQMQYRDQQKLKHANMLIRQDYIKYL